MPEEEAMSNPSLRIWLMIGALLAICPAELHAQSPRVLFEIARSTNRNVLKYEVDLGEKGRPKLEQPVSAYWVMHESGGKRESLSWLERQFAYGWEVVGPVGADGFVFKLSALAARPIRVVRRDAGFAALVSIRDRASYLERVFVQTKEGGALPKVLYIELFGRDATNGNPVSERIMNQQLRSARTCRTSSSPRGEGKADRPRPGAGSCSRPRLVPSKCRWAREWS